MIDFRDGGFFAPTTPPKKKYVSIPQDANPEYA